MVTKPKLKGGLGVMNLRVQNEALLMKNLLHKCFNKEDLTWVKLILANYYGNGQTPDFTRKGSFW
jgi:cytochrome b subunit of formate dehydrogenase